jgi:hypothetical protein
MKANNTFWTPAAISSGNITALVETAMVVGVVVKGTCYGTYTLED